MIMCLLRTKDLKHPFLIILFHINVVGVRNGLLQMSSQPSDIYIESFPRRLLLSQLIVS
jgi:hypothetical protein